MKKERPHLGKLCFKWNFQSPLNANRERFSLMGSRSVDLVKGLSSPLLCAPARRPAHLLGCSAGLASPQLLAQLLRRGTTRPRLCSYPSCLHLLGAGVPTRGTSHWGHPLRVERTSWPDASSFWPLMKIHSSTSSAHMPSIYNCMHVHLLLVNVMA
jgi:hypothetical protein